MSKLLAMMMKPKNYMYATIKGSLTENNGVFSGFSDSNYLQGNVTDKNLIGQNYLTSFGFQVKVSLPNSISAEEQIIYIPYRGILSGITIKTNGKILWYAMGGINVITSSTTFSFGTTIWIKGTINNSVATLYSSIDGTNWITEGSINLDTLEASATHPMRIGVNGGSTVDNVFLGSIDLNQSYIKIANTKYQLQAVVGYTIVGSPTIVAGVVSGFSSSDYLEIKKYLDSDNLEMVIDFTTGNSFNANETVFLNRSIFDLEYHNNGLYSYNWQQSSFVNVIPSSDYITNTHYKIKIKRNGNTISFAYSKNGSAYVDTGSFTTNKTATNFVCLGNSSVNTNRYFNGFIDLNETYIKINNKLWFNGQPA